MTRFLDEFLASDNKQQVIATDPIPAGERDTLLLDPSLFAEEAVHAHDHSADDKIGSCGNSCGGCSKRGTPECDSHEH